MNNAGWFSPWHLILVSLLGAPFSAKSQQVQVNSTCEVNCPTIPSLSNGSTSGTFNFNYTFGNTDKYNISGSYGASYSHANGSTIAVVPVFTYLGTGGGTGPRGEIGRESCRERV